MMMMQILSMFPSSFLPIHPFVYLSMYLSIHLSIYLFIYLSFYPSILFGSFSLSSFGNKELKLISLLSSQSPLCFWHHRERTSAINLVASQRNPMCTNISLYKISNCHHFFFDDSQENIPGVILIANTR